MPFWKMGHRQMVYLNAGGVGGPASLVTNGKMRYKVRWQRRNIPNADYTAMIPDASDTPTTKYFYLSMNGDIHTQSQDANGYSGQRVKGNESASATLSVEGATQNLYSANVTHPARDSGSYTFASSILNQVIKIDVAGREEFWTPWIKVNVNSALTAGRTNSQDYPGYPQRTFWSEGSVSASGSWSASDLKLTLSPSPDNIALFDGSSKGLNQYTIDAGIIPTSVSVASSDGDFIEWLRTHSSWNLIGNTPALRPFLDNYKDVGQSYAVVGPQHPGFAPIGMEDVEVDAEPVPMPTFIPEHGLKFDVQYGALTSSNSHLGWNFPADNSKFGEKTLNHVVGGTTIPAPVALFYPSTGFQHPNGGPTMASGLSTGVPNYVYYYDQAWKNPFGTEVRFWYSNGSAYAGGNFIKIGWDAHGKSGVIGSHTYLFAREKGTGIIRFAGYQVIRGLDLYARCIYHEGVHKRLDEAVRAGAKDKDGDGLPDSIESQIGTFIDEVNSVPWNDQNPNNTGYSQTGYADNETFCRMCERDLPVGTDDWADDGFNWGSPDAPEGPNRMKRVREYIHPTYTHDSFDWISARNLVP